MGDPLNGSLAQRLGLIKGDLDEGDAIDEIALGRAFDLVRAKFDWRAPIDWTGNEAQIEEVGGIEVVREAVLFFTATEASVSIIENPNAERQIRIQAVGYRNGPAGP